MRVRITVTTVVHNTAQNSSAWLFSLQEAPRGSILGPLLFVMYTTPLSTLIYSLSYDHHIYADDNQLFFFFHPLNFDSSISHLQNALQQISSWMTANLLTLNSSKTEFLLIGLKNQLAKIHNSTLHLTPPTLLEILVSSLTSILHSLTKLQLSKACYYHIRQLRRIRPYLYSSTAYRYHRYLYRLLRA